MDRKRIIINKLAELILTILCIVSTVVLCFTDDGIVKLLLMSSNICALLVIFLYFATASSTISKNNKADIENAGQTNVVVAPFEKEKTYSYNNRQGGAEATEQIAPVSQKTDGTMPDLKNRELDEIKALLMNLEEKYIEKFETELQNISQELSNPEKEQLLEELFDIALLAMDMVNIKTRHICSYSEWTKSLIMKKTDKDNLFSLISQDRMSKKYSNLSSILKSCLPEKSFFYSGHKL